MRKEAKSSTPFYIDEEHLVLEERLLNKGGLRGLDHKQDFALSLDYREKAR